MSADITNTDRAEPDFADFLREIWAARIFVFVGALAGVLLAFAFVSVAVPHGQARMVLAPANPMNLAHNREGDGARDQQAAQSDLNFTRFEAGFKGADVAALLLRDPEITAGLAADKRFTFSKDESGWSASKLAAYIAKRVEIDPVGETSLRTYSYLHSDPVFAVAFLSRLHNVTDGLIRHEMRKGVNERIAYLNAALATTNNPDHRRAMTDLLMEQERFKMLVSIDQPYAASVVVKPSASPKAVWPDLYLVYEGFIAAGMFIGFVVFSILNMRREDALQSLGEAGAVEQRDWFFPESGNSNEPPSSKKDKAQKRPLTEKKKTKRDPKISSASDAAE